MLAAGFAVSLSAIGFFRALPSEFTPIEDRATIFVSLTAPEGSSLDYTRDRLKEVEASLKPFHDMGVIASTLSIVAPGLQRPAPVNAGFVIVRLTPGTSAPSPSRASSGRSSRGVQNIPGRASSPSTRRAWFARHQPADPVHHRRP